MTRLRCVKMFNMEIFCLWIHILLALVQNSIAPVESLTCLFCQGVDDPLTCNKTVSCSNEEVCFLDVQGGIYNLGCANSQHCSSPGGASIVGRSVWKRQGTSCHECCSMNDCNADLCKHQKPTTCVDDGTVDCAKMESLFHICKDTHQASLVCPKFCHICTLVDGNWAAWSVWTSCDVTCNKGVHTRQRTCTNPSPADGGLDCVGNTLETKVCQQKTCPVNGQWSRWSPWGSCSASCDVGMQRRDRTCSNPYPSLNGDHCYGESRDDRLCMPGPCADGGWSRWGTWDSCSVSCGGGIRSRQRTCTDPKPSLLGRYCDGSPFQVVSCNDGHCPVLKVAFTAYGLHLNQDQSQLIFPNIHENYGNGYSNNTGEFTCHVAGIYHFVTTLTRSYLSGSNDVLCYLYVNAVRKVGTDVSSGRSLTLSGTFHLNRNDVVKIKGRLHGLQNSEWCSFNGFLVTPDN